MFNSEAGFNSIFFNDMIVMLLVEPKSRKIIEANNAAIKFYGWSHEQILQMTIDEINAIPYEQLQNNVHKAQSMEECHFFLKHRLANGTIRDIEAFCGPIEIDGKKLLYSINFDITERNKVQLENEKNDGRLRSIVKILKTRSDIPQTILDATLHEAISLTESAIGFILRYSEEEKEFSLISWSNEVMSECQVKNPRTRFQLEQTGLWSESIRQRQGLIVNDYSSPDISKNGYPEGHLKIDRLLTLPVFSNEKIVALIGVANKKNEYDQTDSLQLSLLMESIWKTIENVESNKKIAHLNETLHSIYKIHKLINRTNAPQELADKVCEAFLETRNCSRVILTLTDKDGTPAEIFSRGECAPSSDEKDKMKTGILPNCFLEAVQSSDPVVIHEANEICVECPISHKASGQISLIAPLRYRDELYGFFLISFLTMQIELDQERSLISGLVEDLALAFHNMDMRKEKQLAEKDRDSLHSQLIQSQKIEAIGQLAGGVAHDFNNLLSVILGYGEILMQDISADSSFFEPMSEIYAAAERARNLTRQLLAFSRKQVFQVKLVSVNTVVLGFEKLLKRIVGEQIALELSLCEDEVIVKADVAQLEQAMMNLTINARDAMPHGGKLKIATARQYLDEKYVSDMLDVNPGNYVTLSFADTGKGMSSETIEHIFEPFFTTKGEESGTGLGLSTAYGIIRQHGGHIWVDSQPEKGSDFKIFLPLTAGITDPEQEKELSSRANSPSSPYATILVVEDDLLVRRLACKILSRQGYRVFEAENYDAAVEVARNFSGKIDLLLTDVVMPGKEGPAVYKTVAEYCPNIKVIFMSGYSPSHIHHLCKLENFEEFVQKPISVSALLGKVSNILRKKREL